MYQLPDFLEVFEQPENLEGFIWRYMDLSKFIALLHGNLYFPRADRLGDDDYECTLPRGNTKLPIEYYSYSTGDDLTEKKSRADLVEDYSTNQTFIAEQVRQTCYISCWHMNQHESAAMWKLYLVKGEGVAIRSTTQRLLDVTAKHRGAMQEGYPGCISIGKVRYIDFEDEAIPIDDSALHFVTHKRHSFRHEQELRAVHWGLHQLGQICPDLGRNLKVELPTLIEHIFVAPTALSWIEDLVRDLVQQRFGLDLPVSKSAMAQGPLR